MATIVIDTETTGFVAGEDELLQVSVIEQDGSVLFNEYFRPTAHTEWTAAEAVNHISPEMVADCPCIADRLPELQAIFDKADTIIGYNTEFDVGFLAAAGVVFVRNTKVIDVMREFAPIYGEWSDTHQAWKWQKLTTCAAYYGYDWSGAEAAHNALGDCFATLHCYNQLVSPSEDVDFIALEQRERELLERAELSDEEAVELKRIQDILEMTV